jgi:hypothetical protein
MEVFLYISQNKGSTDFHKYNLLIDKNIEISEFNTIYIEIISLVELNTLNIYFILGGTSIRLDERFTFRDKKYIYQLNEKDINNILVSFNTNKSSHQYNINGHNVYFTQLFLNELGYTKPIIKDDESVLELNNIFIKSPKVSDENFEIIIKYLMFNSYFDSDILYKNHLKSDYSDFQNSQLESLKLLYNKVKVVSDNIRDFKSESILAYSKSYSIQPYSNQSSLDDVSFSWLMGNLDNLEKANFGDADMIRIKSKECSLKSIMQEINFEDFKSYENNVILGFSELYISLLSELRTNIAKKNLRTRISSFSIYLTNKFNEYIIFYIDNLLNYFIHIRNFFTNILFVKTPIIEFPSNSDSFVSLPHYKKFFELILIYNDIFSKNIDSNFKSNLEIESFDKLFESYVLFLIKDTLSLAFSFNYKFVYEPKIENRKINKLSGKYITTIENGIIITIHYEDLPEDFTQYTSTSKMYNYNPDYVIEFEKDNYKEFIILDAKYKKYTRKYFKQDIESLTLKYLHQIGLNSLNMNVVGLYTVSINERMNYNRVFNSSFDILTSNSPTFPCIGGIEISPKDFNIENNLIKKLILKHLDFFKMRF